ncbi:hypothetical protein AMATHDRAFT_75196 [Amanita thiersii Skay4041]|uniref:Uncharacterized protein n=1 Tax=Amanita thiersii Skay4041 TaxID=703135 RepID=A0A2A9NT98_9AGAR|nr:hypothetical protein AMATHDRAFT_75196 [Amanita thiersii Skay4041]
MPPQPGMFSIPSYSSKSGPGRPSTYGGADVDVGIGVAYQHHSGSGASVGSSSRVHGVPIDDGKALKDKRRKEISGKLGKEMSDRREDGRQFAETITLLNSTSMQLATKPEDHPLYALRLFPISLERSAILAQLEMSEKYATECAQTAYDEEQERVEEEWRKGRERVRERLMEGIEERRRRAREEKDGEGTYADGSLDSQTRPHITRKLRNRLGTSPPPTPLGNHTTSFLNSLINVNGGGLNHVGITTGPFLNPHSLSVDELPSPFPLPLTSTSIPSGSGGGTGSGGGGGGGRRRPKGSSHQSQAVGGLGKSIGMLSGGKESEIESDLGEIRRGNKRRRAAVVAQGKSARVEA